MQKIKQFSSQLLKISDLHIKHDEHLKGVIRRTLYLNLLESNIQELLSANNFAEMQLNLLSAKTMKMKTIA